LAVEKASRAPGGVEQAVRVAALVAETEVLREGQRRSLVAAADARALLALGGGMPLAAERLAQGGGAAMHARFVRDIGGLQADDVLRLAGQWESWLRSKDALAAGFGLPELADWMQR
ncbi:MAG: hypothetical protein QMC09_12700, partial [Thauera sp.]